MSGAFDHRLYIDDWSAVDCLQALHLKPAIVIYTQDLRAVQSDRVRAIRGASCENPHYRARDIAPRAYLENGTPGFMQPRENPNLLSGFDAVQCFNISRIDLQCCIGRTLPSLSRSTVAFLKRGTYISDCRNLKAHSDIH